MRADEPVVAAAAPAVTSRHTALEVAIRRLERHLASLRKARTELESGRPEPVAADDAARRRADVDHRALREVTRYALARAKALVALTEAEIAKDAGKIGDAAAALDVLDAKFIDTVQKLEASLDAPAKAAADPKTGDSAAPKKATKSTSKPSDEPPSGPTAKPTPKPSGTPGSREKDKPMGSSSDDSETGSSAGRDTLDEDVLDDFLDDADDDLAD